MDNRKPASASASATASACCVGGGGVLEAAAGRGAGLPKDTACAVLELHAACDKGEEKELADGADAVRRAWEAEAVDREGGGGDGAATQGIAGLARDEVV